MFGVQVLKTNLLFQTNEVSFYWTYLKHMTPWKQNMPLVVSDDIAFILDAICFFSASPFHRTPGHSRIRGERDGA